MLFVLFFAFIGYIVFGSSNDMYKHLFFAVDATWNVMMGSLMFGDLAGAFADDQVGLIVFTASYYYIMQFLMICVFFNMLIAILMDGYANIKEENKGAGRNILNYNVGALDEDISRVVRRSLDDRVRAFKTALNKIPCFHFDVSIVGFQPWDSERWLREVNGVRLLRVQRKESSYDNPTPVTFLRLVTLLKQREHDEDEDVLKQAYHYFICRRFMSPEDTSVDAKVDELLEQIAEGKEVELENQKAADVQRTHMKQNQKAMMGILDDMEEKELELMRGLTRVYDLTKQLRFSGPPTPRRG
jgi:hypothetical protein